MMLNNTQFKLIAFDIDGTIMDGNGTVCSRLIEVVAHLKKLGYLFTLVSARVPFSVLEIANQLGIDNHIIALNGSLITNHKHNILYSKSFATTRVESKLKDIDQRIARNYYYQFEWVLPNPSPCTDLEVRLLQHILQPLKDPIPNQVNKITLIGDHDLLVKEQIYLAQDKSLAVDFSHPNYIEITCNTISKFHGLIHYASALNITAEQIIAFGDGENDISMLSQVGLGVAMGNAKPHVKSRAKAVARNNHEQGVAIYLEELFNLR